MRINRESLRYIIAILILGPLPTLIKFGCDEVNDGLEEFYKCALSTSVNDARRKGVLVAVFKTEPTTLTVDGKTFEFDEAWLEAASVPTHPFVWLSARRRLDWNFLVVRPKTCSVNTYLFQEYSVTPEYSREFAIPGPMLFRRWTQTWREKEDGTRYDLYQQPVPIDLRELKLKVDIVRHDGSKNISMGTVTLTAVEE
jgi:hypothetical protein